jgi:hypothetical protein
MFVEVEQALHENRKASQQEGFRLIRWIDQFFTKRLVPTMPRASITLTE